MNKPTPSLLLPGPSLFICPLSHNPVALSHPPCSHIPNLNLLRLNTPLSNAFQNPLQASARHAAAAAAIHVNHATKSRSTACFAFTMPEVIAQEVQRCTWPADILVEQGRQGSTAGGQNCCAEQGKGEAGLHPGYCALVAAAAAMQPAQNPGLLSQPACVRSRKRGRSARAGLRTRCRWCAATAPAPRRRRRRPPGCYDRAPALRGSCRPPAGPLPAGSCGR